MATSILPTRSSMAAVRRSLKRATASTYPASAPSSSGSCSSIVVSKRFQATAVDPQPTPSSFGGSSSSGATTTTSNSPQQLRKYTREEIQKIYDSPLMELIFRAASVHREHHDPSKVQLCTLLNIK